MSRLYSIGFEHNSLTANVEVTSTNISGGGAVAISTSTPRTGTYSFRATNTGASGIARASYSFLATAAAGPYYSRAYFNFADFPASTGPILSFWDGTTLYASVRITSSGTLQLWDSAGQIGSDSTTLSLNTHYMVELYYKSNGSSTELNARLEATSFASTTSSANSGTVDRLSWGMISNNTSYDIFVDDMAINDTAGSFQNTWPGSGKLIYLLPNAAGDNTGFTTGVSDNTNHYLNVDDVAPDDDTTYNQTSTASQTDDYNIQNSGIGASDTINVVHVGVRYRKVTSGTLVFNVRVKASSGGTVEASSNISSVLTTFQTNAEAIPKNYPLTLYDMPGASTTPWTQTDIDAAQIGVATVSNTANNWRVTKMWMIVDYTPSSGNNWTQPESDSVTSSDAIIKAPVSKQADTVTTTDVIIKKPVANKADSVTTSDTIVKSVGKTLSDSVTTSDGHTTLLGKGASLTDSVTSSDANSKAVVTTHSDSVTSGDAISKSPTKFPADTSSVADAYLKSLQKNLGDSVTSSDSFSRLSTFIKPLTDTVTSSDNHISAPTKKLADSVSAGDNFIPSLYKVIDSYSEANETSFFTLDSTGNGSHAAGQTFTANTYIPAFVEFYLLKVGNPTGNAVANIYAITGTFGTNAVPTGTPLATSNTFDISTTTTSGALYSLVFPTPVTLTNGAHYAVVLDVTGASSSSSTGNYIRIGQGPNSHAGNRVNFDDFITGAWAASLTIDACFYLYGTVASVAWTQPESDSVTASDTSTRFVTKSLSDTSSVAEAHVSAPQHVQSDTITSSDSNAKVVHKSLTDSVNSSDSETPTHNAILSLTDTATVGDHATTTLPGKQALTDSVTVTDSHFVAGHKMVADYVTTSDALTRSIVKHINDVIVTTDSSGKPVTHSLTDSTSVLDVVSKRIIKFFGDSVTTSDHVSTPKPLSDHVEILEQLRVFRNGDPIIVPTTDWVKKPVLGTSVSLTNAFAAHRTPVVGISNSDRDIYVTIKAPGPVSQPSMIDADSPDIDADADIDGGTIASERLQVIAGVAKLKPKVGI